MAIYDRIWINARIATMVEGNEPYGIIGDGAPATCDGAIASREGKIAFVGRSAELPGVLNALADDVVDCAGRLITPGLIDPHTHLIFGGDRIADFERRLGGERYADAASKGGGIAHTVAMTRAASDDELLAAASKRLRTLVHNGATTVEIKSGYGLDIETELRLLRLARRLGEIEGVPVRTTFLGAHVVPPEYREDRAGYIAMLCDVLLPQIAKEGLADAVDAFCECGVAFDASECERVFAVARAHGLPVKLHADQLSDGGGAALAARAHALSADHLEYTSDAGIAALARSGTVAIVLPGAFHFLREKQRPPIEAMRAHNVPIALATDCNPGTSPITSLPDAMNLACLLFGLTPDEALIATTRNAARALGLSDRGELRAGLRCDLAIWAISSPAELSYWLGAELCDDVVVEGQTRLS